MYLLHLFICFFQILDFLGTQHVKTIKTKDTVKTEEETERTRKCMYNFSYLSSVMRNPVFDFPIRSDTNQAVQPQRMARGLKFLI